MKILFLRTKCQSQQVFKTQFKNKLMRTQSSMQTQHSQYHNFNHHINNKKTKKLDNLNGFKLILSALNVMEQVSDSKIIKSAKNVMVKEVYNN